MPEFSESLSALLPAFLPQQRWFGGKARTISACEVEDWVDLPATTRGVTLVVAGVSYANGPRERYALLLSRLPDSRGLPSIALLPDRTCIVEAATDPEAVRALLRVLSEDAPLRTYRGGTLRRADVGEAARRVFAVESPPVAAVRSEQSNTSLRVGSTLVLKLFRRLEPGENPELEVGRFLTSRTTFRAMAALEGSLSYQPPDGAVVTLGVLQTWIDNQGDGWKYVLSGLGEHLRTGSTCPLELAADMTTLGAITAEFHAALESDDRDEAFRAEPLQPTDVDLWSAQVMDRLSRVCADIELRLDTWPEETRRLGTAILAEARHVSQTAWAARDESAPFHKIRIHGDYHLGQTLKTASGFAIIDFEGEPATPLAERRQKHCALKDVAGMLRSFDYAIESASNHRNDIADRLRTSGGLREAFLDGYLRAGEARGIVSIPADRSACAGWLAFFELEKALYEVEYEINNRPEWTYIPLRGVLRALAAGT
jgi:trehalose synthase-fused probable maltokinase